MRDVVKNKEKWKKGWVSGLPETSCGIGSTKEHTEDQVLWLNSVIDKYSINSLVDVGAGDLNWVTEVNLPETYIPLDLIVRHPSVTEFNILKEAPPKADCTMCLWVFNHLTNNDIEVAWKNLTKNTKYVIITYHSYLPEYLTENTLESMDLGQKDSKIILVGV